MSQQKKKNNKNNDKYLKNYRKILLGICNGMGECCECGSHSYLNEEMECLKCQIAAMKSGRKLPTSQEELTGLLDSEKLKFRMQEILGQSE